MSCASAPVERSAAPAPPSHEAAALAARTQATDLFYRGKAFALAGDGDCAHEAFGGALEAFRAGARAGDASDLEFAGQLWDSIAAYQPVVEAAARPADPERPPAEDPRDSLVAASPTASPEEFDEAKKEVDASPGPLLFDIPMVVNEQVLKAVAFYQFRSPLAFASALRRSGRYLDLMRGILREEGLPEDLVYVAMVESAFKHQAHSRAAAHGFWQFIDGTGRRYGLHRTRAYDERSDPVKSTRAAAAYFRDLYEMFGDWQLAMAAYDAGEGKILKSLQRTGARDFWGLAEGSTLRRETRDYVPFVLATALIAKDPARFGFDVVPDPPLVWDDVTVAKPVDLARVAEAAGTTLPELQLLNSELKTRSTPHGVRSYELRVPKGTAALVAARLPGIPAAPEVAEKRIKVRKGDTLVQGRGACARLGGRAVRLERPPAHRPAAEGNRARRAVPRQVPPEGARRGDVAGTAGRDPRRSDSRLRDHPGLGRRPVHGRPRHGDARSPRPRSRRASTSRRRAFATRTRRARDRRRPPAGSATR